MDRMNSYTKTVWSHFQSTKDQAQPIDREWTRFALSSYLDEPIKNINFGISDKLHNTDGSNDKGLDFIYIDESQGNVIIIQSYISGSEPMTKTVPEKK